MNISQKLFSYSFSALLIAIPFSALISNFNSVLIEFLLGISILTGLVSHVNLDKNYFYKNRYQFLYLLFILGIGILEFSSIKNFIFGIKYEILYLMIFLFFNSFEDFKYEKFYGYFINSSLLALAFSLLIWMFSNNSLLIKLGYRDDWSTFYLNQNQAFCQKLQGKDLCRFQGFLSSPNHFGLHLLLLNFLSRSLKVKVFSFISVFFTFSRSSLLAFLTFFSLKFRNNIKKWQITFAAISFVLVILYSLNYANLSTQEHVVKFVENLPVILESFWFGHGLNFSGPASRVMQTLIPESHFLQVILNTGVIGFSLFVLSFSNLIKRFWEHKKDNAYILLSLFVPMLFLHPMEDSGLSIVLFAYLAFEEAFLSKE